MTLLAPLPRERTKRIVYIGTPEIAVQPLRALVAHGFDVCLVITGHDKRRGRGGATSPNSVKEAAIDLGIPVSHDIADVLKLDPEGLLGVVVAFGSLISTEILQHVPMINIHYSALPRWRGAAPVERAILCGDKNTAVCIIQVVEQLDAGDVLASAPCVIDENDTVTGLRNRLGELALPLLIDICSYGVSKQQPQIGDVVIAKKITAEDVFINWGSSAQLILAQVRVGNAFTYFEGKRFKIHEALISQVHQPVGSVTSINGQVIVGSADAAIQLMVVQPEGKAKIAAHEWANGARLTSSSAFANG